MTQTMEKPRQITGNSENVPAFAPPRLPYHPVIEERFGIDKASWKALVEAIFPNASNVESVILALSYCRARKIDPFKRNVHIVPIWDKNRGCMVDTIWPGIGELRTTAFRTGEYAGREKAEFGPSVTKKIGTLEITFPEWCQVTVYRLVRGNRVSFAGPQVYWLETYATLKRTDDTPNEMWATRTWGQIEKCAEAAALRAAFPEEIGSDHIADEVEHVKKVDSTSVTATARGVDGLMKRITAKPVSEGQTFEPAPEAFAEAEAERILREKSPSAQEQPEPPADPLIVPDDARTTAGPEAEADAGDEAAAHWDNPAWAEKRCADAAKDLGVKISDFKGGLFKWETARGGKKNVGPSQWEELFRAIASATIDYKTGVIA